MAQVKYRKLLKAPLANLYDYTFFRHILRHADISGTDTVLDLGCGSGMVEHILEDDVKRIVGIDISSETIDLLIHQNTSKNVEYRSVDVTMETPSDFIMAFDKIISINVLEHVLDARKAIRFISKALKQGGTAYIAFPVNNEHHGCLITQENVPLLFSELTQSCKLTYNYLRDSDSPISWIFKKLRGLFPLYEANDFKVTVSFKLFQMQMNNILVRFVYNVLKLFIIALSYFGNTYERTDQRGDCCLVVVHKNP